MFYSLCLYSGLDSEKKKDLFYLKKYTYTEIWAFDPTASETTMNKASGTCI
jgi:hypothetical protein